MPRPDQKARPVLEKIRNLVGGKRARRFHSVRDRLAGSRRTTPDADIDHYLQGVEIMFQKVTSAASAAGSISKRLDQQGTFLESLYDSIESGVGRLVDADMEQETAKLSALQTQQQLSVNALSIANQEPQNLLTLLRQ